MFRVKVGDNLQILKGIAENSIDALVTDPPAGIAFMGKEWDEDKGGRDHWITWMTGVMTASLRVLKPGGHALIWSLPRTSHWTALAVENAGFEIRDVVTHIFGTGYPKSLDVARAIDAASGFEGEATGDTVVVRPPWAKWERGSGYKSETKVQQVKKLSDAAKKWEGFGTGLKPAAEFWLLCRKPLSEKTIAENVLRWGTGAISIDKCRINTYAKSFKDNREDKIQRNAYGKFGVSDYDGSKGRFPANLILDEEAARLLDEQAGAEDGEVSRFFYVAKPSGTERNEGLDHGRPTKQSPNRQASAAHALFDEDGNATWGNDP